MVIDIDALNVKRKLTHDIGKRETTMAKTQTGGRVARTAARIANTVLTSIDDVITLARTVTPATFDAMIARANANHGVVHAGRNVARFTGQRIVFTQNATLTRNAEWQLDDCQLLFVWRVLFPMASGALFTGPMVNGIGIVRGVRAHYNRDGHGMPTGKPAVESVSYGAKRFDVAPAPVVPPNPVIVTPKNGGRLTARKRATK